MAAAPPYQYPWYQVVSGDEIQQGDIFNDCPVFWPREVDFDTPSSRASFSWAERDVIVMSQSCDLVIDHPKVHEVLLCALWQPAELKGTHIATPQGLEEARRGSLPAFHLLAPSSEPGFERDFRIVQFRRLYTLPFSFVRRQAARQPHLRLLPPYREHLSQAFARYFMRVGLPTDIPSFK